MNRCHRRIMKILHEWRLTLSRRKIRTKEQEAIFIVNALLNAGAVGWLQNQ